MAALYYGLGPYRHTTDSGATVYAPPEHCIGAVDLASLADLADSPRRGVGFFACTAPLDSNFVALNASPGDCRELSVNASMRAAWRAATEVEAAGETLADLLWNHLTAGSDPRGLDRAKPLMPTAGRRLELHLPDHGRIRSAAFTFGRHPHTNRVRAALQIAYQQIHDAFPDQRHARRVLDFWGHKYNLRGDDVLQLVPLGLRRDHPGRLPHATVYADDFNRADEPLGAAPHWSGPLFGGLSAAVVDQQLSIEGTSPVYRRRHRFEQALSSEDHYAELVAADLSAGATASINVLGRISSDGNDFYVARTARAGIGGVNTTYTLRRVLDWGGGFNPGSSDTTLATLELQPGLPVPFVQRLVVDGSTLRLIADGEVRLTSTDTVISGNVHTGLASATLSIVADDWNTGDLALPPADRSSVFGGAGYGPIGSKIIRNG